MQMLSTSWLADLKEQRTYMLKPCSNRSFFKLIISDQMLIKLKLFFPVYGHFNGQTFSGVFENFSITSKFLRLKCKNRLF